MKTVLFLNRDLRIQDNKTLFQASEYASELTIVYCMDGAYKILSSAQKHFIKESLKDLSNQLRNLKSQLYLWTGEREDCLEFIGKPDFVYVSAVYNIRDSLGLKSLENYCKDKSIGFLAVENACLYKLSELPFEIKDMPVQFTKFRKAIEREPIKIKKTPVLKELPPSMKISIPYYEEVKDWFLGGVQNFDFKGGEASGQERLRYYLWESEHVQTYKETRNGMLVFDDSTKFSPWLAVGALSASDIMIQLKECEYEKGANESTYWVYFELLWRDFFKFYSLKYQDLVFSQNGISHKKLNFNNQEKLLFENWKTAETQNDFIDANMNELNSTGWMSNRGRQNVASYLAKHLNVDWRRGAEWFAKNLIDYDVESNWGNWAYNSGVGADPRDRVFNIERQQSVYDPEGLYVKKFLKRKG
jgi:deoxyribodipyrimidine photo-lyase